MRLHIRIVFLLLLSTFSLIAKPTTMELSSDTLHSAPYAEICIDKEKKYTLENIESATDCFKPDSRITYGFTKDAIWTHLQVENSSDKEIEYIAHNPFANLNWIDVSVLYDNGRRSTFLLGGMRLQSEREIPHRLSLFKINLKPKERAEIFIRHQSTSSLNVNWEFTPFEDFLRSDLEKGQMLGLAIGIIFALIVYNFTLYLSLRDSTYLFYILFGFGNMLLLSSLYGYFLMYDHSIDKETILAIPNLMTIFNPMMLNLFIIKFFDLKKSAPKLYKMLFLSTAILGVMLLFNLPRFVDLNPVIPLRVQNAIVVSYNLVLLSVAIYVLYRRFLGSLFFLFAILMISALGTIGLLHFMGRATLPTPIVQYAMILIALEMFFISLALSRKVNLINNQRKQAEHILLEQVRFNSIGNAIAEMVHQIKVPISQLGAISARISLLFEKYAATFAKEERDAAHDLEQIVDFLDGSVSRIHQHYTQDDIRKPFDVVSAIESSIDMFEQRLMLRGVEIKKSLQACQTLGAPITLQNVLIAIIENALDILQERNVKNPYISIRNFIDSQHIVIEVSDNGDGIRSQSPNDVFMMYYSNKVTKGFGIGLGLAKNLVEHKLSGEIHAENIRDGALFTIHLPLLT